MQHSEENLSRTNMWHGRSRAAFRREFVLARNNNYYCQILWRSLHLWNTLRIFNYFNSNDRLLVTLKYIAFLHLHASLVRVVCFWLGDKYVYIWIFVRLTKYMKKRTKFCSSTKLLLGVTSMFVRLTIIYKKNDLFSFHTADALLLLLKLWNKKNHFPSQ